MEENQLKILEKRINNAITFIENLKTKEKMLVEEREEVKKKVLSLEETVKEKDLKIEALKENQLFLKSKIEAILNKLESLANMEAESSYTEESSFLEDSSLGLMNEKTEEMQETEELQHEADKQYDDSSEIIIEETIVDLKNEQEGEDETSQEIEEEAEGAETEEAESGQEKASSPQSINGENPLFESENSINIELSLQTDDEKSDINRKKNDDNPFIEM